MLFKLSTVVLVCACLVNAVPVENESARKPVVIDIPAGPPPEDIQASSEQKPEVTKVDGNKPESDVETIPTDSSSDEVSDFRPTFVIIRTRPIFSSSFGQSPFFSSPFGSGSGGSLFGNSPFSFNNPMRPVNRDREPVSSSSSDSSEAVAPFDGSANRPSYFNVDDLMTRLQQQMSSLWGTLLNPNNRPRPVSPFRPFARPFNPFDTSVEETGNNTSSEEVFNIDKFPANYTNSTSETKVIDGNVVQVNRTIHKISSGNNTRGFFQFQVINVKPQTTPTTEKIGGTVDEVTAATREPEKEKPEVVPTQETNPPKAADPEADPTLNEVDEKKPGGIDQGLL